MKKILPIFLCALLSFSWAYGQGFDRNKFYRLTTQWQGDTKSLDVLNDGQNNQLHLTNTGGYSGQAWKITDMGNGYYRLTTQWQGEDKSLDVVNDGKNNRLHLAKTGAYTGQAWSLQDQGNGYYRLTCQWLGGGKSLDVVNDGVNNKIQMANTAMVSGQLWRISEFGNDMQVSVNAHLPCYVALIKIGTENNASTDWWSKWHEIKTKKSFNVTPYTFSNISPGKYVLVAYNPASVNYDPNNGNPAEASDGVVLEEVQIRKGTRLNYSLQPNHFVNWNCLSCPWLYAFDGDSYTRLTEVIQDVVGKENCKTTSHTIDPKYVINGKIRLKIQEEKEETSYLDRVTLMVGDEKIYPSQKALVSQDENYVTLEKGELIELEFDLEGCNVQKEEITLECNGFYLPKKAFLEKVYQKYLLTK